MKKPYKATKKPVEIQYYPATGEYLNEIQQWSCKERPIRISCDENAEMFKIVIATMEGEYTVTNETDDIIIRGIKGEVYPCKRDIFEATYDLATPSKDSN